MLLFLREAITPSFDQFSCLILRSVMPCSVAVLVTCVQNGSHVQVGVVSLTFRPLLHHHSTALPPDAVNCARQGGLVQCGLILVSALLLWAFRTSDDGYGFIH